MSLSVEEGFLQMRRLYKCFSKLENPLPAQNAFGSVTSNAWTVILFAKPLVLAEWMLLQMRSPPNHAIIISIILYDYTVLYYTQYYTILDSTIVYYTRLCHAIRVLTFSKPLKVF